MWKGEWKGYATWLALRVMGIAGALTVVSMCGARPPLHVRHLGDEVVIDVQTLGEYQTTITRIRVSEKGRAVWEVKAADRAPQIHTFGLRLGVNTPVPISCGGGSPSSCGGKEAYDGFVVVSPSPWAQFYLERGKEYEVEVWGSYSWWSKASASFTL